MDIRLDKDALAADDAMTVIRARPLDRAKAISGLINEEALASERLGRLTDKAAAAMLDANLFSIRLPKPEGGLGGTGVELFEATEEIARADGSAGWCMLISNTGSTFVHIGAGVKARREVFGNGAVACWGTLLPKARSVAVEAGFRVSGDFSFGSSSSLARWVVVAGPLADRDGQQWFRAHLLPKEDVEIKEGSWDVMGLRATASIDYVIADKFVPAHRTFEYPFLPDGNPQHASAVGLLDLGRPGVAAFASGIGLRALDELIFATAIGIFLGTIARSMPQLGLLYLPVFLPMNILSGSNTPLESMPAWLATLAQASPSTHFVSFAQAILYRGAGFAVVWPQFVIVALIGGIFLGLALLRFRKVSVVVM